MTDEPTADERYFANFYLTGYTAGVMGWSLAEVSQLLAHHSRPRPVRLATLIGFRDARHDFKHADRRAQAWARRFVAARRA